MNQLNSMSCATNEKPTHVRHGTWSSAQRQQPPRLWCPQFPVSLVLGYANHEPAASIGLSYDGHGLLLASNLAVSDWLALHLDHDSLPAMFAIWSPINFVITRPWTCHSSLFLAMLATIHCQSHHFCLDKHPTIVVAPYTIQSSWVLPSQATNLLIDFISQCSSSHHQVVVSAILSPVGVRNLHNMTKTNNLSGNGNSYGPTSPVGKTTVNQAFFPQPIRWHAHPGLSHLESPMPGYHTHFKWIARRDRHYTLDRRPATWHSIGCNAGHDFMHALCVWYDVDI